MVWPRRFAFFQPFVLFYLAINQISLRHIDREKKAKCMCLVIYYIHA